MDIHIDFLKMNLKTMILFHIISEESLYSNIRCQYSVCRYQISFISAFLEFQILLTFQNDIICAVTRYLSNFLSSAFMEYLSLLVCSYCATYGLDSLSLNLGIWRKLMFTLSSIQSPPPLKISG